MKQSTKALLAAAGAALVLLLFLTRRRIAMLAQFVFTEARKQAFVRVIPARTRLYAPVILRVAQEENVSPFLIAAFMERESRSGTMLKPPGPGGTGDGGHGHGLLQIDDRSHADWIKSNAWYEPYTNVKYGVKILKQNLAYFRLQPAPGATVLVVSDTYAARQGIQPGKYSDPRPLQGYALWEAAIAAYNTGVGNVIKAVAAGKSPDTTTANKNYSSDILAQVASWEAAFDKLLV